jgi:hypothetical protein
MGAAGDDRLLATAGGADLRRVLPPLLAWHCQATSAGKPEQTLRLLGIVAMESYLRSRETNSAPAKAAKAVPLSHVTESL